MATSNLIPVTETRFCLVDTAGFASGGDVVVFNGVCGALEDFAAPDQQLLVSEHGRDPDGWYWVVRDNDGIAIVQTGYAAEGKYDAIDSLVTYLGDVDRVRRDFIEELSTHM